MTITSETIRKAAQAAQAYRDLGDAALEVARALGGWSEEMVGDGPDYSVEDLVARCERLAGELR